MCDKTLSSVRIAMRGKGACASVLWDCKNPLSDFCVEGEYGVERDIADSEMPCNGFGFAGGGWMRLP